jgi:hypothetical protein
MNVVKILSAPYFAGGVPLKRQWNIPLIHPFATVDDTNQLKAPGL